MKNKTRLTILSCHYLLKINFNNVFLFFFKKYRKEAVSKNTCLPFKKIRNKS